MPGTAPRIERQEWHNDNIFVTRTNSKRRKDQLNMTRGVWVSALQKRDYSIVERKKRIRGSRETRDWRTLLTVETGANGDSKRTNERGPSVLGSLGSACKYKRFLSYLGCSSWPVHNIFFLTVHYLVHFSTSPRNISESPLPRNRCFLPLLDERKGWRQNCFYIR